MWPLVDQGLAQGWENFIAQVSGERLCFDRSERGRHSIFKHLSTHQNLQVCCMYSYNAVFNYDLKISETDNNYGIYWEAWL
jgi:hypothetical protein